MKKVNVAVIFGGTNTEHEVSIVSAQSIVNKLDPKKYNVLPVYIGKDNHWRAPTGFLNSATTKPLHSGIKDMQVAEPQSITAEHNVTVVFPIVHGPYGEDGTLQGMLDMLHLPYVGSGVLGSALCMDKVVQKQLCRSVGIPVPNWTELRTPSTIKPQSFPVFVKPANQGSSVGVSKAHNAQELDQAIKLAFQYDTKVIIEEGIANVREIECSVLGNEKPEASVLGEIVASNEFYDYDAKYVDGKSQAIIPAKLSQKLSNAIKKTAVQAFSLLNCSGLARVDFLLDGKSNKFYLNELNTLPGFTSISMYPKLWEASGLSYEKLLNKLIELALEHHQQKSQIKLSYQPKENWFEK